MMDRRSFLGLTAGAIAAAACPALSPSSSAAVRAQSGRPQVAFLGTVVRTHSHAQHFLDRLTAGYAWGGEWVRPRVDVASVFIDQFPEEDLAKQRIAKHKLRQCDSIREALTLGTDRLAVDGVVIIGEHGVYPRNEKGQTRYPRYEWFREVARIFEETGRSVPVFNDKHLSTEWSECVEMVELSRRLRFPFLAGSSLPVTWRLPQTEMPDGADLKESVCVAYGGVDSYDFHAYETAQCMSERRRGGETGVASVQGLKGDALWQRLESDECRTTRKLFVAGLTRSHNLPVEGGFPTDRVTFEWARQALPETIGLFVTHRDGFRTTIFLTAISDFNYAGELADGSVVSCQMYLPMPGRGSTTADFFNPLTRHIEDMMLTRKAPYPVERTLVTSGMVIGGVESLHAGGKVWQSPDMEVHYSVSGPSTFWQS